MKVIGIIPARYKSSRLFGKPLIKIKNKPLIQLTYESVLNSNLFDLIFITTESKKIKEVATSFGAKCIITSEENINGTERCGELVHKLNDQINDTDLIINIQCDEPFIKKVHLKKIINLFIKTNPQIGTLICPINELEFSDKSIVKLILRKDRTAIDFQRRISNFKKNNKKYKHVGIYAYRKKILLQLITLKKTKRELNENLEQLRWIEHKYMISCVFIKENLTSINTIDDLKKL